MVRATASGSKLLKAMIVDGAASRGDLCRLLGVSKAAVTIGVSKLLDRKFISEGESLNENRVGRKTTLLTVRPDLAYFIGTDLEGLAIRVCILDAVGNRIYSAKRAISTDWTDKTIFRQWSKLITDALSASSISSDKIAGMGVGLPGTVNREKLSTRTYLPPGQWVDFDISKFKAIFELETAAANNVVCISEFERKKGKAAGLGNFISLLIRYGIGACVYSNESLALYQEFGTGELGHMRISLDGPKCICGKKGCLDVFASGRTFAEIDMAPKKTVAHKLKKRAKYIGIGVANMLKLFHVQSVLINGIYNEHEEMIRPVIEETLVDELQALRIPVPAVLFGEPVELKTCTGAAMKASEELIEKFLERNYFREEK